MLIDILLDFLFPHKCVCGKWGSLLCESCYKRLNFNATQVCPICRKVSKNGQACPSCRSKTALTGVMVFAPHDGVLKQLIWDYKYLFIKDLGQPLSLLLEKKFGEFLCTKKFDITCVPISKKRLRWRGYNQSEILARKLAEELNLDFKPVLTRAGGKSQVGLTRKERLKNLKGKIKFVGCETKNKKIVIVDDVYTSGATLEECAKELRKYGYREVYGMVLSRD